MNLPSQKLFIVFIPAIIILGIFSLIYNGKTTDETKNIEVKPSVVTVQNAIINEADTDLDGVPDWEEALWKTDPKKPKTFNNIPDSEYITTQIEKKNVDGVLNEPIVTTDDLSKQLFTEYIQMKKSGKVDAETISKMTARIAGNVVVSPLETPYTETDVKTFPDNDIAQIQVYADALMALVSKYTTLYASQVDVTNISTSGKDFIDFTSTTSGFYLKLSQEIMKLKVPKSALSAHLNYANSLKESAQGMEEMSQIKNDQMKSLSGISRQSVGQADQGKAIENLSTFFSQSGIIGFNLSII